MKGIFPQYQVKDGPKIHFLKNISLKQLYQQTFKTKTEEYFPLTFDQEFKISIFVFRVHNDHQEWNLYKNFTQLYGFQQALFKKYSNIPQFPIQKDDDRELTVKQISALAKFLEIFVKAIYQNALKDPLVISFFDFFPDNLGHGIIYGEYPMFKRSGGRYNETSCMKGCYHYLCPCIRSWKMRYFTVTDNGILYTKKSKSFDIKDMLLFCFRFTMYYGLFKTGKQLGLVIESSTRRLKVEGQTLTDLVLLIVAIQVAINQSPFAKEKRKKFQKYGSFAPIRHNCSSKFYADGKNYFSDLCDQLKKAKKYVYITGWMITPYFMLKRPNSLMDKSYRLDGVLQELAKRNVKIYIIVYQQPKIAVNNDSQFVEQYLQSLGSQNIKVMRHPNYIVIPFLWSHHQKIIMIDQRVAFFGGLDICYGRWDTGEHLLQNPSDKRLWEGADFCNMRIKDIYKPRQFNMTNLQQNDPRMPWHDIAIQIRGSSVHDIARHFTNYWNFVNFQTKIDNDRQLLNMAGIKHQSSVSKFTAAKNYFKKKLAFRRKTGKVQPMIQRSSTVQKRRESIETEKESQRRDSIEEQQFYEQYIKHEEQKQNFAEKLLKYPIKLFQKLKESEPEEQALIVANQEWQQTGNQEHLLLRSASTWSGGLSDPESSIHQAYIDVIRKSKHFIYIQNQFFIARENQIINQIAKRILLAYSKKQNFKVVVFIPLLPGFEGDVRQNNSTVMRIQLHLQYQTICRSNNSLYSKLLNGNMKQNEIEDYIKFFSLRQHGFINQTPVTQILYIHSKLMIVDDEKMIIGSANINDRSMLGDRDSQIAILVQDSNKNSQSKNDNVKESYSKEIRAFRINLFQQHFSIIQSVAEQFTQQDNWKKLIYIAKRNTQIYRYVFGCYPDDKMKKFKDVDTFQKGITPKQKTNRYMEQKHNIRGHVVELPLKFLEEQKLEIQITEKEIILPDFFFT